MFPFQLTSEQAKQIEQAKASGEGRVRLELTEDQRRLDKAYIDEIDELVREELGIDGPFPSPLAMQLRASRKAAGMSLSDVAEKAHMTKQAVLKIESGQNANPKVDTLKRIAEAIGKAIKIEIVDIAG